MAKWGGRKVPRLRAQLIADYGPICWRCHKPITGKVTVGHVIPRRLGGSDDYTNLRPECEPCNYADGARATNGRPPVLRVSRRW